MLGIENIFHLLHFSRELRLNIIKPNHKFYFDRFKDVDKIDYMSFKEFLMKFLKNLKMKVLIQGNLTKSQSLALVENVQKNLNQEVMKVKELGEKAIHLIPKGEAYLRVKSLMPSDKNSVIKNYYQIDRATIESVCLLELLVKVMREPLFNFIRTKEQLGYSVSCAGKNEGDVLGLIITVESQEKRHSSWTVDNKIESFLQSFSSYLEKISEEDFVIMKSSIIASKRSSDTDLETEVNRNWIEIKDSKYEFERNEHEALQLELLCKNDLTIFFKDHFSSENMKKLSTQVIANADSDDSLLQHGFLHLDLLTDEKRNTIKNIAQFKCSLTKMSQL